MSSTEDLIRAHVQASDSLLDAQRGVGVDAAPIALAFAAAASLKALNAAPGSTPASRNAVRRHVSAILFCAADIASRPEAE